jgi:hypothetical protein
MGASSASPLGAPSSGGAQGPGGPSIIPPPLFGSGGATGSLSPLGGNAASAASKAGPSDFTRMISTAPAPVVPTPAAPAATPTSMNVPIAAKRSIPMGLIIIINVVVIIAIVMVFMLLRKPQVPTTPTVEKPAVKVPAVKPPAVPKR